MGGLLPDRSSNSFPNPWLQHCIGVAPSRCCQKLTDGNIQARKQWRKVKRSRQTSETKIGSSKTKPNQYLKGRGDDQGRHIPGGNEHLCLRLILLTTRKSGIKSFSSESPYLREIVKVHDFVVLNHSG